jgi:hypothetical protein
MDVFSLIQPILVGAVLTGFMQVLKKYSAWVNTRPAWLKSTLVVGFACVAQVLTAWLGTPFTADPADMSAGAATALLTALSSMGWHAIKKAVLDAIQNRQ